VITGIIVDVTGSYYAAFMVAGVFPPQRQCGLMRAR
jgi:hypothetical protein